MTTLETDPLEGTPLLPPSWADAEALRPLRNHVGIERELHTFLSDQILKWGPDLIIVLERKGTAIVRALKEWAEDPLDWLWERVISSSVLDQRTNAFFKGKRILIFDDMMHTGGHLRDVLNQLYARGIGREGGEQIRVAAFAIHEEGADALTEFRESLPHTWFYTGLGSTAYQKLRFQIVEMLARAGSLLLDTEHIELRLQLKGSFRGLVDAFRRRAHVQVFSSLDQRKNITVLYEDDKAHTLDSEGFPEGTSTAGIVKKCRVVQRAKDEFAIIPICYPSVPASSAWSLESEVEAMLGEGAQANACARFYAVALLAAQQVLQWAAKDLAAWDETQYTLSLPRPPSDAHASGGYTLEHLIVMYPTLNIDTLSGALMQAVDEGLRQGRQLRHVQPNASPPADTTDEELRTEAIVLLQVMRYLLDSRALAEGWWRRSVTAPRLRGLTVRDVFGIGERLGWSPVRVSTLCDILIDQAYIVPRVEAVQDAKGRSWAIRTFEPDGEIVSELVRRHTAQRGLPSGV